MAKTQYRYSGESKWAGLSGNAVLALYNTPGSNKKISVHSVEIYNKHILGYQTGAASTNVPAPVRFQVARVTSLAGGYPLTPSKMDTNAASWPSSVEIKQRASYVPTLVNWNGSVTYTDATVAANDLTFTPGSAPSWIANEHRDAGRYFVGTSGNVREHRIIANTTTACDLDPPLLTAASTTGYIAQVQSILHHGVIKMCSPAIASIPVSSNGYISQTFYGGSGQIFGRGNSTNQQDIIIRANEQVAVFAANYVNSAMPVIVEATFIVEGTPNRTYQLSFYTHFDSQGESILSINNTNGSGQVVRLVSLSVSEVGTMDTPYFQLVPIGSIDPASFDDPNMKLTVNPTNSSHGALNSSIAQLFTNVPVIPFGVPISYIAEGAPAAATPRGFNYLNAKDFIGPVYATFFPEAAAYMIPNTTFWTTSIPGTIGTHVSQELSKIKGYGGAPIIIREGEALGIVSGAETATLTTAIGISGFAGYEFSLTFTVEDAVTPTIELTGLKADSEVRAYVGTDPATATLISGTESSGTSYSFTHDVAGQNGYIMIFHLDYAPIQLNFTPYLGAVVSIPIQQVGDRQYNNPV